MSIGDVPKDNVLVLPSKVQKEQAAKNKFEFPFPARPRVKPVIPGPGMVKLLQDAGYNVLGDDPYPDSFYGVVVQMARDLHECLTCIDMINTHMEVVNKTSQTQSGIIKKLMDKIIALEEYNKELSGIDARIDYINLSSNTTDDDEDNDPR